ncbi:proline--tRNA ligase [Engelhardtia mirabilis]|uniref:Proline--tRNA ligase n=1 Tax=Engelhardtia mirabilis TaxID=2528011 RepID=A0A518BDK2_9BACT|nr:Proline--tRNA ligase [Planctomycetes bacterium Pla133]QDU99395.1 Proline--tRNA ligase [Planctomycetes bacterium Pla86]
MAENRITPRAEDYAQWYQDVIAQAQLAEAAGVVKGCMVIRPHGYAIWEAMQADLDRRFKATGHQNASFPLLIPMSFMTKEAEHVEGFAPELAVVTQAGGKELEEPYAIRPTSETIIGHFFSKWIDSHRDLPLLINQWANVMRWELRTRLFLRTSEFLWQEGHTAHATHAEAREEAVRMHHVYRDFCHEIMAMPVIRGIKTANERFAGALETLTIEALMQDGKALQAGTSHDLGQNFGRAFDVQFQNDAGEREYVWQTSWGVSTRLVGALIMTHSDDDGLVLPPKLAPIHVVIVPIFRKDDEKVRVLEAANRIAAELRDDGLNVKVDDRVSLKPGAKYYEWERKGVPLRIEIGPRDLDSESVMTKLRVAAVDESGRAVKEVRPMADLGVSIGKTLDEFQTQLFDTAQARLTAGTVHVDTWDDFVDVFKDGGSRFVYAHWDGTTETELAIKNETKATIRCLPTDGDGPEAEPGKCIKTGADSAQRVLFAKNY